MKRLDDKVMEILKPGSTKLPAIPDDMFVMNRADARMIAAGLLPDGLDVTKLTPRGRQEIRDAIDLLLGKD